MWYVAWYACHKGPIKTLDNGLHYEISSGPKTMYKLYTVYKIYYAECIIYFIIPAFNDTEIKSCISIVLKFYGTITRYE